MRSKACTLIKIKISFLSYLT